MSECVHLHCVFKVLKCVFLEDTLCPQDVPLSWVRLTRLLGLIFLVSTFFSAVILFTDSWASFNLQEQSVDVIGLTVCYDLQKINNWKAAGQYKFGSIKTKQMKNFTVNPSRALHYIPDWWPGMCTIAEKSTGSICTCFASLKGFFWQQFFKRNPFF